MDEELLKAPDIEVPEPPQEDEEEVEDKMEPRVEKSKEMQELENRARYERNDMVNFDLVVDCEPRQKNELNNSRYVKITISK